MIGAKKCKKCHLKRNLFVDFHILTRKVGNPPFTLYDFAHLTTLIIFYSWKSSKLPGCAIYWLHIFMRLFFFMIGKGSFNGEEKKWRENLNKSLFISFAAFLSTKKTSDPWKRERQVKTVFSDKVDAAAIKRTISQTHLVLLRKRLRFRQIWSGVSHSRNSLG